MTIRWCRAANRRGAALGSQGARRAILTERTGRFVSAPEPAAGWRAENAESTRRLSCGSSVLNRVVEGMQCRIVLICYINVEVLFSSQLNGGFCQCRKTPCFTKALWIGQFVINEWLKALKNNLLSALLIEKILNTSFFFCCIFSCELQVYIHFLGICPLFFLFFHPNREYSFIYCAFQKAPLQN